VFQNHGRLALEELCVDKFQPDTTIIHLETGDADAALIRRHLLDGGAVPIGDLLEDPATPHTHVVCGISKITTTKKGNGVESSVDLVKKQLTTQQLHPAAPSSLRQNPPLGHQAGPQRARR